MTLTDVSASLTGEQLLTNIGGRERPSRQENARLAGYFCETRGRRHGHDVDDWLSAEQELARPKAVDCSRNDPTGSDGKQVVADGMSVEGPGSRSLRDASVGRLACLFRHWTWADEAKARFERELADGWDYDEDPVADHPFGAYYHWCALLCGFSEAALEHGLLSGLQLDTLSPDLEATLPGLRACRQLLVVIPASVEEHPRIVDLLRDDVTVGRLRRVHYGIGKALREEQMSRELDLLLYEH